MSELPSVFEGSLPANTDALAKLMETNDRLAGGGDKEWRVSLPRRVSSAKSLTARRYGSAAIR